MKSSSGIELIHLGLSVSCDFMCGFYEDESRISMVLVILAGVIYMHIFEVFCNVIFGF
jgi:hypothetical protein